MADQSGEQRLGRLGKLLAAGVRQLTLFVRHQAWLDARPGKGDGRQSRREKFLADELAGTPRAQLATPPIDDATEHFFYLVEHLMRVGPSTHGEVLSFTEIGEWARTNGYRLFGWEAEALRSLSASYLIEHHAAEDLARPPPYAPAEPVIERSLVSQRILEMYERMAAEDGK